MISRTTRKTNITLKSPFNYRVPEAEGDGERGENIPFPSPILFQMHNISHL